MNLEQIALYSTMIFSGIAAVGVFVLVVYVLNGEDEDES